MAKSLFKKKSIMDSLVNVGVGGAANVAIDYAWSALGQSVASLEEYKNIIKVAGGAIVGSMVTSKVARAAADGVATVGVANLIAGLMGTEENSTSGLPAGTIGRVQAGNPYFGKKKSERGFTVSDAFINK
ncbi:MAG: hypothetical protein KBS70_03490 [Bacteroidales bacterium]|nr:hypothetical protein [Candidatus Colicola equi]